MLTLSLICISDWNPYFEESPILFVVGVFSFRLQLGFGTPLILLRDMEFKWL